MNGAHDGSSAPGNKTSCIDLAFYFFASFISPFVVSHLCLFKSLPDRSMVGSVPYNLLLTLHRLFCLLSRRGPG